MKAFGGIYIFYLATDGWPISSVDKTLFVLGSWKATVKEQEVTADISSSSFLETVYHSSVMIKYDLYTSYPEQQSELLWTHECHKGEQNRRECLSKPLSQKAVSHKSLHNVSQPWHVDTLFPHISWELALQLSSLFWLPLCSVEAQWSNRPSCAQCHHCELFREERGALHRDPSAPAGNWLASDFFKCWGMKR